MKRILRGGKFILTSLALLAAAAAAGGPDLQQEVNSEYSGKVLTLRRFYEGDHLKFLSDGRLHGDAAVGPWTLDGRIEVREIRLKDGLVEIKGRRVQVIFEKNTLPKQVPKPLDELTLINSLSGKHRDDLLRSLRNLEVTIDIEMPSSKPSEDEVSSAIHSVFIMPGESMVEAVPAYWRAYFSDLEGLPRSTPWSSGTAYHVGRGVSPPKIISAPGSEYSEEARKAKYQCSALLWLVVDATGTPRDIQILRPAGLGLDERAVEAVSRWRFDGSRKNGVPVSVEINAEVSFRLY